MYNLFNEKKYTEVFMFESILSRDNISFKELEQICFKIACEFAKEMLKTMLEEYDKQLMDKTKAYEDDMLEEGKKKLKYYIKKQMV